MSPYNVSVFLFSCLGIAGWMKVYEKCYLIVPYNFTWERANTHCQK